MYIYIDERFEKIVDLLLKSETVSILELQKALDLSKRSIYYEINKINDWLKSNEFTPLRNRRGVYSLSNNEKSKILESLAGNNDNTYIYSQNERLKILYLLLFYSSGNVSATDLADRLKVSRTTIFKDFEALEGNLSNYNIEIDYDQKTGYKLMGDPITLRSLFLYNVAKLKTLIVRKEIDFIDYSDCGRLFRSLKTLEKKINIKYTDNTLFCLAVLMSVLSKKPQIIEIKNLKKDNVLNSDIYKLVSAYFPSFDDSEKLYISVYLLGSRISTTSDDLFISVPDDAYLNLAKKMIYEFEHTASLALVNKEELLKSLCIHLNASFYRYKYGIQLGNVMLEDIKKEYAYLFEITKQAIRNMQADFGVPISEGEIAYLSLHFGTHIGVYKNSKHPLRIAIICASGISAASMIKRELLKLLSNVIIVGTYDDFTDLPDKNNIDLLVSSTIFKTALPVVFVNPILSDNDKKNILSHPLIAGNNYFVDVSRLIDIVSKYVKQNDRDLLKDDIYHFFNNLGTDVIALSYDRPVRLLDVLSANHVQIIDTKIDSWIDAVYLAGQPLLDDGSIEERYLSKIVERVKKYGPFFYISNQVVLAHARPEEGAKKLDISLFIFKHKIKLDNLYDAKIFMVISTTNFEEHLSVIKDIMDVFLIQSKTEQLIDSNNPKEIMYLLEKWLTRDLSSKDEER